MVERLKYKQLEQIAFVLLFIIAFAIGLLFFDLVPLIFLKIALLTLLLAGTFLLFLLRAKIKTALRSRKVNFKSAFYKFERIYQSNVIGIIVSDFEGRVLDANPAFLNLIGYTRAELKAGLVRWDSLTPPEFKEKNEHAVRELKSRGVSTPFEKQYIRKDGSRVWVLIGSSSLGSQDKGDAMTYVIDITDKKLLDQKADEYLQRIQHQEEEFKSVLMDAPAFITIRRGPELRYQFVNKAVIELAKRDDHIGKTPEEMHPGAISSDDARISFEVYETGIAKSEMRHKLQYFDEQKQLQTMYLDYVITPVYDYLGKIDGIATYGFDVTNLVLANQEMEISKDRFAFVADTLPHKIWMADANGKLIYTNREWLQYIDVERDSFDLFDWKNLYHPSEIEEVQNVWRKAVLRKEPFEMEALLRRSDNSYRFHSIKGYPLKDSAGEVVMWVGANTDVHDQKLEVQELKASEDYFKSLAEGTPFMVWRSDEEGRCVYTNKQWTDFTGLSFAESLGYGFSKMMDQKLFEERQERWTEAVKQRTSYESKFQLKRKDGEWRWVYAKAGPYYSQGEFKGFIGSLVDITEQELATRAIQEASAKKDEFLSIASHELKTPLTSIKAFVQLLGKSLDKDHRAYAFVEKANQHSLRLEKLISDLLDVSKINAGKLSYQMEMINFDKLLRESVESVQHTSPNHRIIIEKSANVVLEGDRLRLEQVVNNLVSNAVKYSPEANQVVVRSEQQGNSLVVSIQDFGVGIEERNLAYLFDRYYRVDNTAMRFQGLGLGLFIASEILKRHSGTFWVESEPGKGSVFYFLLPLTEASESDTPQVSSDKSYSDSFIIVNYNEDRH